MKQINHNQIIKVGFCVAYDWEFLRISIPRIYNHADCICLSIDKRRRTWKGEKYSFNEKSFRDFVSSIDEGKGKIDVYEGDFSRPELSAMENDTRQRQLMAERMGTGGWHIQIDSDEYFLNFDECAKKLKALNSCPTGKEKPLNVCVFVAPLIKKLAEGYLCVDFKNQYPETMPFATTKPEYVRARNSGHFNIYLDEYIIHETWARSEDELWLKINNWGHSSEEMDVEKKRLSYFNLWKSLDEFNYQYIANFHPAIPTTWPALKFVKAQDPVEVLACFGKPERPMSQFQFWMKNNRQIARVRHILKM